MRILGLTDLHSGGRFPFEDLQKLIQKEAIELLIIAGDLTTWGNPSQVKTVLEEIDPIDIPIFYVPGNMDSKKSGNIEFSNISPLHGRMKLFSGIYFVGLGGSNKTPFKTPFTLSEKQLATILDQAYTEVPKGKPLFVISHAPPLNSEADRLHNDEHVGSSAVREFIEENNPLVILCGHIHESKSISKIDSTLCVNPGPARHRNAAIIEILRNKENELVATSKLTLF